MRTFFNWEFGVRGCDTCKSKRIIRRGFNPVGLDGEYCALHTNTRKAPCASWEWKHKVRGLFLLLCLMISLATVTMFKEYKEVLVISLVCVGIIIGFLTWDVFKGRRKLRRGKWK